MTMASEKLVYVVEDSISSGALYSSYLEQAGYQTRHFTDGHSALLGIKEQMPDVLLQDVCLPDISGLEVMRFAKERGDVPVIIITANSSIDIAVDAMRLGGFDFIEKPFSKDRLMTSVASACEQIQAEQTGRLKKNRSGSTTNKMKSVRDHFVGDSSTMNAVYNLLESAARSKASVFVTGESGTGKEVCAQSLHSASARASGPFIAINCAAIPTELFESEIFGHEKGAFSGAVSQRIGAAEQADGGTLFLDEICEMDLSLQAKLLRFLQTGSYQRVGGQKTLHSDIRIVCATNRDPAQDVAEGLFREDLYYRLNVIRVQLPPLRARGNDVITLANHFLREKNDSNDKHFLGFTNDAEAQIKAYPWPGNIRELQNVIENIVVIHDGDYIEGSMLESLNNVAQQLNNSPGTPPAPPLAQTMPTSINGVQNIKPLWQVEKEAIESAISQCGDNIPLAAACLGVSASTIYRKIKGWENSH
ncbi:Regulatory protein LuxO [Zhongshania aliphaticivorans]|uniref:Regulatory protein LuxO n=1 Tax=Zhongshania aliphaticivorans TaxID=1470434 RepID=A0A5S9NAZ8_9GAMM|nr:sigma-54 dependent transcriptional regulator [Zhongshania aliphaticivorans]CAA0086961.1 Regulatory protein LuxO [Zhongshania aliphaticivorans]CAA0113825.1 Regulatory protein LuxO [Zhongshania aliphaticivorans]